jgi:hypothetical protein
MVVLGRRGRSAVTRSRHASPGVARACPVFTNGIIATVRFARAAPTVDTVLAWLRRAVTSEARCRRAWLVAIVAVLAFYKLTLTRSTFTPSVDGGYYLDVAAHVRDGHGLLSSCSILYEAYPRFPHPTAVYPLWPLLMGWVAKLFPIFEVGKWLATACYFVALGFAYLWATALVPRPLLPRLGLGAGHVLVLMLGLHEYFFVYTSLPYTEGLSYALAFAALWRMTRLLPRPTWAGGLEIGVWLGLVILARYQLVLMAMAALPVLAGAAVASAGPRRAYARMTICAVAGLLLVVGPHYLYVASFTPHLTPGLYVQWQRVRFGEGLSPIPDVLEIKGAGPWILDRLEGFRVAFDVRDSKYGYLRRYHGFQYAIVAAAPLLVRLGVQRASRDRARAAWGWARRPENLNWVHVVCLAAGCFVMIHAMHMNATLYPEWYFSQRHALVCVFAFFLSLVLLLAQPRLGWRLLGVLCLVSGTGLGLRSIHQRAFANVDATAPGPSAFVRWLDDEAKRRGGMVVALRQPQTIAYLTRGVGFHWYYAGTTLEDIRAMVAMGAAYVILPGKRGYPFTHAREFESSFRLVKTIEGNRIYAPAPAVPGAPEPALPDAPEARIPDPPEAPEAP